MKRRTTFALILAATTLFGGSAFAGSGIEAEIAGRFHEAQSEQLSRIDQGLASGEIEYDCAASLYVEQKAVRSKFEQMAADGSISRDEFDLSNMMLDHAEKNINGHCTKAR